MWNMMNHIPTLFISLNEMAVWLNDLLRESKDIVSLQM